MEACTTQATTVSYLNYSTTHQRYATDSSYLTIFSISEGEEEVFSRSHTCFMLTEWDLISQISVFILCCNYLICLLCKLWF